MCVWLSRAVVCTAWGGCGVGNVWRERRALCECMCVDGVCGGVICQRVPRGVPCPSLPSPQLRAQRTAVPSVNPRELRAAGNHGKRCSCSPERPGWLGGGAPGPRAGRGEVHQELLGGSQVPLDFRGCLGKGAPPPGDPAGLL